MAKIYGLFGSMTGKLADVVMAVRNGEQVARKYQPVVYNPSSPAQIAQRAKLKALSQLSAIAAPVIAMPKRGSMSSRNLFTKKNFPNVTYADSQAEIVMANVQLTDSVVGLPLINNTGHTATQLTVSLDVASAAVAPDVDRVVYVAFAHQADGSLRFVSSTVVSTAGADGTFEATIPITADPITVLGYGVRDNTEAARVIFGDLESVTAEQIAHLVVTRTLTETDVTMTETRGFSIPAFSE